MVKKFESAGVWFCTAAEAAQWFRRRREVTFGTSGSEALASTKGEAGLPGLRLRSYQTGQRSQERTPKDSDRNPSFSEVLLDDAREIASAI
jgi:hypothetical protein